MSKSDSNIGQVGVKSIRLKGKKIDNLPLGQGNQAKEQLPMAIENERLSKIEGINKKYPTQRIDYLSSRIVECKENIDRINGTIDEQNTIISDYKGHISMCKHRNSEVMKLSKKLSSGKITDEEFNKKRNKLKKKFPPYNIEALEMQIVQCGEAIVRCKDVIEQENDSITEFSEGKVSRAHTHNVDEALFILSGSGKVKINNVVYPVRQNDFLNVPRETEHTIITDDNSRLKIFFVFSDEIVIDY